MKPFFRLSGSYRDSFPVSFFCPVCLFFSFFSDPFLQHPGVMFFFTIFRLKMFAIFLLNAFLFVTGGGSPPRSFKIFRISPLFFFFFFFLPPSPLRPLSRKFFLWSPDEQSPSQMDDHRPFTDPLLNSLPCRLRASPSAFNHGCESRPVPIFFFFPPAAFFFPSLPF